MKSGNSLATFAKEKNIPIDELKPLIESVRNSPCIKYDLDKTLKRNANKYLHTVTAKKEQLLEGKIGIKDIKNIDGMLKFCTEEEREKVNEKLANSVASHNISILEYSKIFGIDNVTSGLPNEIIKKVSEINNNVKNSSNGDIRKISRDIYKEVERIKKYSIPYKPENGETLGYFEKLTDKQPKEVQITDEHRKMAKQYLHLTNEFVCKKTMNSTLMDIVRGTIDDKKIERLKKEKELNNLQKKDKELDDVVDIAEQVLKMKGIDIKDKDKDKDNVHGV